MKEKWTLVTGASGFLGGAVVRALLAQGEHVRAFVRPGSDLSRLAQLNSDRLELAVGDCIVEHTVYRALAGCHRLYHLAARHQWTDEDPNRVIAPAVEGTAATLQAAKRRGIERIVYTSCATTLGTSESDEPMDEDHEFNLHDPETYVKAKVEAEQVALDAAAEGLPVVIVMPSSVAGPGDAKPTPLGVAILQYLKNSPNFKPPVMSGGFNVVDVRDVAEGHVLAMQRGRIGERYILGGDDLTHRGFIAELSELTGLAEPGKTQGPGMGALVGTLAEIAARWSNKPPPITRKVMRDFAGAFAFVTSEKAERELGYQHRPLRESLQDAVRWFVTHGYLSERAKQRIRLELRAA